MRAARSLAFVAAVLCPGLALAQQTLPPRPGPQYDPRFEPNPQERMIDQADRVLRTLRQLLHSIPVFDPPVITPEGDILIRRRPLRPYPLEPRADPDEPPTRL